MTPPTDTDRTSRDLDIADSVYPESAIPLRRPVRSETYPDAKSSKDAAKSAKPSMMPSKTADPPITLTK